MWKSPFGITKAYLEICEADKHLQWEKYLDHKELAMQNDESKQWEISEPMISKEQEQKAVAALKYLHLSFEPPPEWFHSGECKPFVNYILNLRVHKSEAVRNIAKLLRRKLKESFMRVKSRRSSPKNGVSTPVDLTPNVVSTAAHQDSVATKANCSDVPSLDTSPASTASAQLTTSSVSPVPALFTTSSVSIGLAAGMPLDRTLKPHDVSRVTCSSKTQHLYRIVQKLTNYVGGAAVNGAIYGEITAASFQRVMDCLKSKCNLGSDSCFIDIGSGFGKPNLHAVADANVSISFGLELEFNRWKASLQCLEAVATNRSFNAKFNGKEGAWNEFHQKVFFAHADVCNMQTLLPFTHIYMFDKGFAPRPRRHIAKLFKKSRSAQYIVCFMKPAQMVDHGFECELVEKISTKMCGSGEGNTAWVYKKENLSPPRVKIPKSLLPKAAPTLWCKSVFAIRKSIVCTLPPVPKSDAQVDDHEPSYSQGARFFTQSWCKGDNQEASPQYVRWLMDQRHFNGRRKRVTKRTTHFGEENKRRRTTISFKHKDGTEETTTLLAAGDAPAITTCEGKGLILSFKIDKNFGKDRRRVAALENRTNPRRTRSKSKSPKSKSPKSKSPKAKSPESNLSKSNSPK